jgi:hypothetical protein
LDRKKLHFFVEEISFAAFSALPAQAAAPLSEPLPQQPFSKPGRA